MIEDGKKVKFSYTLKVDGKIIDESSEPLEFVYGESTIVPGLQEGMKGMKQGEKKTIQVLPEKAYGKINPEAIVEIPKERMPQGAELNMVISAKSPEGQTYQGRIIDIRPETVLIDFNHPLAGKQLEFDVEILSIDAK